jgi:hypothetical protein
MVDGRIIPPEMEDPCRSLVYFKLAPTYFDVLACIYAVPETLYKHGRLCRTGPPLSPYWGTTMLDVTPEE